MSKISPKTALITGAARRIGRAIAAALARDGWAVVIHYHGSSDDADAAVGAIRTAGGRAYTLNADFAQHDQVAGVMQRAIAVAGPIGCLINNASIFERDDIGSVTPESWSSHVDINLRAPLFLSQAFAEQLPRSTHGAIINIIDQRVWNLTPHFLSYTVSKTGLWTLTQTLALALAPRIRVNAVGPGPTLPSPRQSIEQFAAQSRSMPLGRGTSPDEIAAAVGYILSAESMTGQMIALDGGQHLGWGSVPADAPADD